MADEKNYFDGNREYRSDLFSMLLNEKEYALDVYNAVNDSDYDDPEEIEIPKDRAARDTYGRHQHVIRSHHNVMAQDRSTIENIEVADPYVTGKGRAPLNNVPLPHQHG